MTRKEFIKLLNAGLYGMAFAKLNIDNIYALNSNKKEIKNWLWLHPWRNISEDEYKRRLEKIKLCGIDAIIPNIYGSWRALYQSQHLPASDHLLEKLLPIAKSSGLEVHAWMWTMICNVEKVLNQHPEWFAINRNGLSTKENPAYVNYYRFMCPNHPEVKEFILKTVSELSAITELDGIHLDYIRYPDVILAEKLQEKYGIVQDKEYAEYDYCYCNRCISKFKSETGIDIKESFAPDMNNKWLQFRYDSITDLVNDVLIPPAKKRGKMISAAVFPNWKHVRQEWSKWKVDAVFPMLYSKYYNQDDAWIQAKIKEGLNTINSSIKLYSGLLVDSYNPKELSIAIEKSLDSNADGVSLFAYHSLKEDHYKSLAQLFPQNK
jgi:uncharacterized lipoprotein YddW (UPF0748 family)